MYKYFNIGNRLVPFIGGGMADSIGSILTLNFEGIYTLDLSASKSTDILFTQLAIGEGPIYRINPNGPQDIEIDNKYIDDLVDFNTNNVKSDLMAVKYHTGTLTQPAMSSFFPELTIPVNLSSPVVLKSGLSTDSEVTPPPETSIRYYPTTNYTGTEQITSIRIKVNVVELKDQTSNFVQPAQVNLVGLVHERNNTSNLFNYIGATGVVIDGLVEGGMVVNIDIPIPEQKRSSEGYRVSILKLTPDISSDGIVAEVEFLGFDEVRESAYAYPRTALAGYAVKSSDFRTGSAPQYTSLVKGLLVDVPSNYNQPILESGEVDWRQIEVPASGEYSSAVNGYRLQNTQKQLLTSSNIKIYDGIWDGTYKKDWSENPVWIVKFLLTDKSLGLGLDDRIIDKFNFYSAAQYCDAVNPITGAFVGVPGIADGTYRYKPNGYKDSIIDAIVGLPDGTEVLERRFVCGLSITDSTNILKLIQAICASFRAVITIKRAKIMLVIDKEGELPEAIFNETNIEENSFSISGINEEDIITGVEVSYIDLAEHFKKQSIVLDVDRSVLLAEEEKRVSIDATGCTRKGQALRLAKYSLETSRNLRRKVQFTASMDASDLTVGSIISVSQRTNGLTYGFGGVIASNSAVGASNVRLEHLTSPQITDSFFTSNTYPILLKIFKQDSNKIDHYIVSNTYSIANNSDGSDTIELFISRKLDLNGNFISNTQFSTITAPHKNDLWALGYVSPEDVYSSSSDKLFRIDSINIVVDNKVSITASEYDSSILALSDNAAKNMTSVKSKPLSFTTPPPSTLSISSIPTKTNEGIVTYNMLVSATTDSTGYTVPIATLIEYARVEDILDLYG